MIPVALLLVLAAASSACAPSLEGVEAAGARALEVGDLSSAERYAQTGLHRATGRGDTSSQRRFRVLAAEVLVEQRRHADALSMLDATTIDATQPDVIDLRALIVRGRARCLAGGQDAAIGTAEADLEQAARLAAELNASALAGDIARHRGNCAGLQGDFAAADMHFRRALALARANGLASVEAKATGSLGLLRVQMRRYDEAVSWLTQALTTATELKADLIAVKTLTNLGWCHYTLGAYDQALAFLVRAGDLAQARGYAGEEQLSLQMLGNVHYRLGDSARAERSYRRSLELATGIGDRKRTAELLGNLAIVQLDLRQYDQAARSVADSLRIKTEMSDVQALAHSLLARGQISEAKGRDDEAETLYRRVLESPRLDTEVEWETRASLAGLWVKRGRVSDADEQFREAFGIIEASRAGITQADHKISYLASLYRFYRTYIDFLVTNGEEDRALGVADRSRAQILREQTGTSAAQGVSTTREFQRVARSLNAVILFYWLGTSRSFLWTVTPDTVHVSVLPSEEIIRRRADAHQAAVLRSRDPLRESMADAQWLYTTLIAPAARHIPHGSRVVFIPDGALHRVNPETFVVVEPAPHYWIDDVVLLVAPSISVLTTTTGNASAVASRPGSILIVGDPLASGAEFPQLPHASREVTGIAAQFPTRDSAVYAGPRADPPVYARSSPAQFSFIHFAAHAEANPVVPLESAVVLSPGPDGSKLYAKDIISIPVLAELVTISACRSAGSRTYAGEGQVGLAWAFLTAGARNVIAGLWDVEDASTSDLMVDVYRALRHGHDPAGALRQAKLRLLRSESAYRKPFYWAPFVTFTRASSEAPPNSRTRRPPQALPATPVPSS